MTHTRATDTIAIRLPGYQHRVILEPGYYLLRSPGAYDRIDRKGLAWFLRIERELGRRLKLIGANRIIETKTRP